MESRAKILGHPIHQMLIVLPMGLLASSLIFDVMHLVSGSGRWAEIAYWMIAVGVISGLVAAVFGLIDWLAIPRGTRARRVGMWHGLGNVVMIGLFAGSWLLRARSPEAPPVWAIACSFAGVGLSMVTGWLGGELVDRLGVGVDDGAHLNSPNSLSRRSASEGRVEQPVRAPAASHAPYSP